MRAQRVVVVELLGHLGGKGPVEAAANIDLCQLPQLAFGEPSQLRAFDRHVGQLDVALGRHRHVFTRAHRQRTGDEARQPSDEGGTPSGRGARDTQHETCRGHDAVVGAENRGPQPCSSGGAVTLPYVADMGHGLTVVLPRIAKAHRRWENLRMDIRHPGGILG